MSAKSAAPWCSLELGGWIRCSLESVEMAWSIITGTKLARSLASAAMSTSSRTSAAARGDFVSEGSRLAVAAELASSTTGTAAAFAGSAFGSTLTPL